jgi:hypothetical protein
MGPPRRGLVKDRPEYSSQSPNVQPAAIIRQPFAAPHERRHPLNRITGNPGRHPPPLFPLETGQEDFASGLAIQRITENPEEIIVTTGKLGRIHTTGLSATLHPRYAADASIPIVVGSHKAKRE